MESFRFHSLSEIYLSHQVWPSAQSPRSQLPMPKLLNGLLPKVTQCKDVSMSAVPGRDEAGKGIFLVDGEQIALERKYAVAIGDFTPAMCAPLSALGFRGTGRRIDTILLDYFRSGDRALAELKQ